MTLLETHGTTQGGGNGFDLIPYNTDITVKVFVFAETECGAQFQRMFCEKCGNYIEAYLSINVDQRITCNCHPIINNLNEEYNEE